jgi:predicted neuraminidase
MERSDGSVAILYRTSRGKLYQCISFDGGETWGSATPMAVPNPDSKVNAITLTTGEVVQFKPVKLVLKRLGLCAWN